jgi:galactokinase
MMKDRLIQEFKRIYGSRKELLFLRAPGRVNLIGEHTDYNGGFVFPAAINLQIFGLAAPRQDNEMRIFSVDLQEQLSFKLSHFQKEPPTWGNYVKGVATELQKLSPLERGADVAYISSLPLNSGLSSSAAFEMINALMLTTFNDIKISPKEMALLCQRAENDYVGVNCGMMDQFAVALCQQDAALFIDTLTLEYQSIPLNLGEYRILIANSNKPRTLADSAYNQRRAQCELAVTTLARHQPRVQSLRDADISLLESIEGEMDQLVFNRARHVIEENGRVLASIEALKENDLARLGRQMDASHQSLKDLYQVSCRELDVLVEEARKVDGVIGSRMTGAGFGGCTVTIIHRDQAEVFSQQVGDAYNRQTGRTADFTITPAVAGAAIQPI